MFPRYCDKIITVGCLSLIKLHRKHLLEWPLINRFYPAVFRIVMTIKPALSNLLS